MTAADDVAASADDRARIIGRLFRGIAHEWANGLNTVLMNAELLALCTDDRETVESTARTIADEARAGGALVRALASFAAASDYCPAGTAPLAPALVLAQHLVGSRARRAGVKLDWPPAGTGDELPLETTAVAFAVAALVDELCTADVGQVDVRVEPGPESVDVRIGFTGGGPDEATSTALRFAREVVAAHGGSLDRAGTACVLRFPRAS